jgi:ubiquinone/menaquinone biosynthesis C-methylase UbiE
MSRSNVATARVQRYFDRKAAKYDREIGFFERHVFGEHRQWAATHAAGKTLELALGTGLNLPHYGPGVTSLVGVELAPQMLQRSRERATMPAAAFDVQLEEGDVQHLRFGDESFDTVLATYSLCTIPDPLAALDEAARVLKPGGTLVTVDHGVAANPVVAAGQHLINPLTSRLQSDHMTRSIEPLVRAAGFTVTHSDRAGWGGMVHRVIGTKP